MWNTEGTFLDKKNNWKQHLMNPFFPLYAKLFKQAKSEGKSQEFLMD